MFPYTSLEAGRVLLQTANEASSCEIDVIAHIAGIGKLSLRSVEFIGEQGEAAKIRCWPAGNAEPEYMIVPLTSVRGIAVKRDWAI